MSVLGNTNARRHGMSQSPEYVSWRSMKQRCLDEDNPLYPYYGGRGITVHQPWLDSFEQFLADVGKQPAAGYTLERKKNDGHYEPGNVKWATKTEQARNRRSNHTMTAGGVTLTLVEWCERLGCNRSSIHKRLNRGMTEEEALTTPFKRRVS